MELFENLLNHAPIIISVFALIFSLYNTYVSTSSNSKIAKENREFSYLNNKLSELREAEKKLLSSHDSLIMQAKKTGNPQLVIQFHNLQLEIFSDVSLYLPSTERSKLETVKNEIVNLGEHINETGVTEMPQSLSDLIYKQYFQIFWSLIKQEITTDSNKIRALKSKVSAE